MQFDRRDRNERRKDRTAHRSARDAPPQEKRESDARPTEQRGKHAHRRDAVAERIGPETRCEVEERTALRLLAQRGERRAEAALRIEAIDGEQFGARMHAAVEEPVEVRLVVACDPEHREGFVLPEDLVI